MLKRKVTPLIAAAFMAAGAAQAAVVSPVFTDQGANTTDAQNTRMYRADLTGLGLSQIAAITINDSNSGIGGSAGAYSGFDLDAIFLDADGDASTLADQVYASSFLFNAGSLRPGGPSSNTAGPTNGSASVNAVDTAFATLDTVDALYFSTGSVTLGDGGRLTALFSPDVLIGSSLFLFVGEVSGDFGEFINAAIEISDTPPPVPLPASALLMLSGFGVLGFARRKSR